jgi:hypothetical protein
MKPYKVTVGKVFGDWGTTLTIGHQAFHTPYATRESARWFAKQLRKALDRMLEENREVKK